MTRIADTLGHARQAALLAAARLTRGRPPNLVCHVTSRCSGRCRTCYHHDRLNAPAARELTLPEWERVAARAPFVVNLSLSGGEPFMRDDLAGIAGAFARHCRSLHVIGVSTNGLLPDAVEGGVAAMLGALPRGVRLDLALSLDGVGAQHDRIRGTKGAYRALRETAARLQRFRRGDGRFTLIARTTMCVSNQKNLAEIRRCALDLLGADRAYLSFPHGHARVPGETAVDAALFERLSREQAADGLAGERSLAVRATVAMQGRVSQRQAAIALRGAAFRCAVPDALAVVAEDGEVLTCEERREGLGNLRDHGWSLEEVLRGPAAARFRREARGSCRCSWYPGVLASLLTEPGEVVRAALSAATSPLRRRRRPRPTRSS